MHITVTVTPWESDFSSSSFFFSFFLFLLLFFFFFFFFFLFFLFKEKYLGVVTCSSGVKNCTHWRYRLYIKWTLNSCPVLISLGVLKRAHQPCQASAALLFARGQ